NDVGAFNRFPIVRGHSDAQLFRKRGWSLRMSYRGGDPTGHKESVLQIRPQQNATQLTCAEHGQFFVRKFEGHGECFAEQREIDSFVSRLSRCYPRGATVYVARPTRSIP